MHWTSDSNYCPRNVSQKDYGGQPIVLNMDCAVLQNQKFRTTLWTGNYLQAELMSIPIGKDIGAEVHEEVDHYIRVVEGCALVQFGDSEENMEDICIASEHSAVMIPAGTWHNIINCGGEPLKMYSIAAPPQHPFGNEQDEIEREED